MKVGTTILDKRNRARKNHAECLCEEGPSDITSIRYVNDGIDTRWELENGEFFEPYRQVKICTYGKNKETIEVTPANNPYKMYFPVYFDIFKKKYGLDKNGELYEVLRSEISDLSFANMFVNFNIGLVYVKPTLYQKNSCGIYEAVSITKTIDTFFLHLIDYLNHTQLLLR